MLMVSVPLIFEAGFAEGAISEAGLCSSWADESSPVHGYKQMFPDSASVTEIIP